MQKTSLFFLILLSVIALLGFYESLFPIPTTIAFTRFFALSGFFLLCISLIIGPLVILWPTKFAQLMEPRRAVGIAAFVLIFLHFLTAFLFELNAQINLLLSQIPVLIAVIALVILFALTLLSNDFSIKKLGVPFWKSIQRLNYLAFILAFVHFLLENSGIFVSMNSITFVNLAEIGMIALGILTILLQITGFLIRTQRKQKTETTN